MEKDLKSQEKELTDDINSLNKKVSEAAQHAGCSAMFTHY